MKDTIIIAKCLGGYACRYHGKSTPPRLALIDRLEKKYGADNIYLICAEQEAGLSTPRPPTYWKNNKLISNNHNVTPIFMIGANKILNLAKKVNAIKFYGLRNSPSCDPKNGITCKLLAKYGIKCHYG